MLLEKKDLFLVEKVKYTFTGYAMSQLNTIKRQHGWFLNPPKNKPERKDYRLDESTGIPGSVVEILTDVPVSMLGPSYREELKSELLYRQDMADWNHFQVYKVRRNPKRRALEEKFGYDTKHAMYLFRLLYEGKELLRRENHLPITNAESSSKSVMGYSYEEVIRKVEAVEKALILVRKVFASDKPDRKA